MLPLSIPLSSVRTAPLGLRIEMHPPELIVLDQHYSPQFYAELWGVSPDTIVRWFQDVHGVLKLSKPGKRGRTRVELRIPFRLAMKIYEDRTR
jgi:hypothetical protein